MPTEDRASQAGAREVKGLCLRCRGACCEEMEVTLEPRDFFDHEWITARLGHLEVIERRNVARPSRMTCLIPVRCPKLTEGTFAGLCSIHGEEAGQPTACRLAAVGGPECLGAIRRLRPMLWAELNAPMCACGGDYECEGHRA